MIDYDGGDIKLFKLKNFKRDIEVLLQKIHKRQNDQKCRYTQAHF